MTHTEAENAILKHFITTWNNALPFADSNEMFETQGVESFVVFRVNQLMPRRLSPSLASKGHRRYERHGEIFFQIFMPLNGGTYDASIHCENIRNMFEGEDLSGIRFLQGSWRRATTNEKRIQYNGSIPFTFDEIK